jgi:hypothetical protein
MSERVKLLVPMGTRHRQSRRHRSRWPIVVGAVLIVAAGAGAFLFLSPAGLSLIDGSAPLSSLQKSNLPAPDPSPSSPRRVLSPAARAQRIERVQTGCTTAQPARVATLIDSFPGWPEEVLISVACKTISAGMSGEQLRVSWGPPRHVVPNSTPFRPIETWQYEREGGRMVSVLLWDGTVKSWQ